MSEEEENGGVVEQQQEQESNKTTMADSVENPQKSQQQNDEINKRFEKMGISFSIWPPTQRTRDAVINRLIETLSTPSVLSKRYGSMSADEASSTARLIEEDAFNAAAAASGSSSNVEDDGIEILQIYSKEISKRMLESVKAKAASATAASENENPVSAAPSEETSSGVES